MNTEPLVSVILPVYNVEAFLPKCLESLLAQSYSHFEAILVDDGSRDKSGEICDEYAQKDARFKVIHKENEGVTLARIKGLQASEGEYVAFMDSDDYIAFDYLEKLLKSLLENDADVATAVYSFVRNGKELPPYVGFTGVLDREGIKDLLGHWFLYNLRGKNRTTAVPSTVNIKMYRREILEGTLDKAVGLWTSEDMVTFFAILLKANRMVALSDCIYYYVLREGSAIHSVDVEKVWKGLSAAWEKAMELDKEGLLTNQLKKIAWLSFRTQLNRGWRGIRDYKHFVSIVKPIVNSSMFQKFVLADIPYAHQTKKDWVRLYLLKFGLYRLYYWLMRYTDKPE